MLKLKNLSISDYFHNIENRIRRKISAYSDEELLRIIEEGLIDKFLQTYLLPIIEKDDSRKIRLDTQKGSYGKTTLQVFYPIIPK